MLSVTFLSSILLSVVCIVWANHVADDAYNRAARNQQHFCALVTTLDGVYQQTPPTTATGREVATEMHRLKIDLGC
jgi:hypothetical protein